MTHPSLLGTRCLLALAVFGLVWLSAVPVVEAAIAGHNDSVSLATTTPTAEATAYFSPFYYTDPRLVPAKISGPLVYNCKNLIVFIWTGDPANLGGTITVEEVGTQQRVASVDFQTSSPIYISFAYKETKGDLGVEQRVFDIDLIAFGQPYTVSFKDDFATTFERAGDGREADYCAQPLETFLAALNIQVAAFDSATNLRYDLFKSNVGLNNDETKRPGQIEERQSDEQSGLPADSLLGLFVNTVLDIHSFKLGDREYSRLDLLAWLYYFLVLATAGLGSYFFVKRRRLWGVVYDARTKNPVEMAVVRLFDQEHHKLLETRVTPKSGRYSFLAEPGEFYLEVTKEGYHFPSRIVTKSIDNEYSNLYRGEVLKLGAGQSLLAPDIPVDSESGEVKKASFYRRVIFPLLDKLRLPILLVGLLLAPFMFLLTQYAYLTQPYLLLVSSFLLVIFLISEFLFVRRGRK